MKILEAYGHLYPDGLPDEINQKLVRRTAQRLAYYLHNEVVDTEEIECPNDCMRSWIFDPWDAYCPRCGEELSGGEVSLMEKALKYAFSEEEKDAK